MLAYLLPDTTPLRIDGWHLDASEHQITLRVTSMQPRVARPLCEMPAHRCHSRYARTLADLPWGQYCVRWELRVRNFFCDNLACPRRLFTERLPGVCAPWARRTLRFAAQLLALGLALGGTASARLSPRLGLTISRHTLLRVIRRAALPPIPPPQIIGVDDWAYRKGQTYGTVLIDLERGRPVALLPDREAKTLAQWLQAHPGVTVITRDRSRAYADGARLGASTALQVADRFHLLQNLAEALDQVFNAHRKALDAVNEALRQAPVTQPDGTVAVPVLPPPPPRTAQELAHLRQARRLALHQQIWALHHQGWPGGAIAKQLGIGKNTVFRYLRTATLPERKRRTDRGRSILTSYKTYLLERWNAGCRGALRLFRELQQRGYSGSYATIARYAQRVRQRQSPQLDPWLARAADSLLMPLQRFAKGLRDDYDAVKAGVTLPWSKGPVEGHINRLKMLKRQVSGRASLDLLQRRFLLAA